jgi:hypothetical protein
MKPRTKRFAAALLAFSALSGGALADEASEAQVRGWIESLDKSSEWAAHAASVSSQGAATIVSGLTIAREDGSFSLVGEELRFDDVAASEGFSVSAFAAKKLVMGLQPAQFSIPTVEVKGLSVPSLGGWSLDPKAPATSFARLYTVIAKTRLDLLSIPEVSFDGYAGPGTTARYVDLRYEGLSEGRLKLQSIGKIETVAAPGTKFSIEGMSARNMDLAAFARVVDPDAYRGGKGDGKWMPAVEGGTYGKVTVTESGKPVVTIADISFGEMSVRQAEAPFAGAIDELIALGPNPPDDKMFDIMSKHLSGMVGWFRVSSLTMSDMQITAPDGGKGSLAKIALADLSADGMKRLAVENFSAEGPGVKVGLKLFEIGDVTWPSLMLLMNIGRHSEMQKSGEPMDVALVDTIAGSFLDMFPKVGHVAIKGVSVDAFGTEPLSLESLTVKGVYGGGFLPREQKSELKKLIIPGPVLRADPQAAQFFDALGYDRLVIGGAGTETYDRASGAYASESRLGVENAGALAMYLAFGGLTPERIKAFMIPVLTAPGGRDPDPAAMMQAADGMSFNGFSLRFEDASLTKRLMAFAAKMQNMDEQTLIANAAAMMQLGMSQLQDPDFTAKTMGAITAFLKEPKSLTFAVKPPAPITVQSVMTLNPADPGAAIKLFGVSVTAND